MPRRPPCPRPPRVDLALRAAGTGILLLLGGCHYASSPLVGFGGFIGNTHSFSTNPNLPPGHDENTLYSEGRSVALDPLLPQGGNVWPGPPPPIPTLNDVEKQQSQFDQQGNQSQPPPAQFAPLPSQHPGPSSPPVLTTPSGPLINNGPVGAPGGASTATNPTGGTSIVVPNGNGTSTVIGPDGSTSTIPTPR